MEMQWATVWESVAGVIPDSPAVTNGDTTRTWAEYEQRAARIAAGLVATGLEPGARVALCLYNGNEYLEAQFATFKMRGVPINVNYRYLDDELWYLLDNSDTETRLESGIRNRQRISTFGLVEDLEIEASLDANARGVELTVTANERDIDVDADPQLLSAAVSNLLQNAFKFSRPGGHVSLRTSSTTDRALIEVEDECGGLPPGTAEELFRPFERRSADRNGLGLGLSLSRRSVEANGGKLRVRDLPGKGCIFTIELPRLPPL